MAEKPVLEARFSKLKKRLEESRADGAVQTNLVEVLDTIRLSITPDYVKFVRSFEAASRKCHHYRE